MSKDARINARSYYQSYGRDVGRDFWCLSQDERALVVWLPRLVALMKPVCSSTIHQGVDLECSEPCADAWYVHLLVGDFAFACELAQGLEPLPLLCFQRGSRSARFHVCDWLRFINQTPNTKYNTIMGFLDLPSVPEATPDVVTKNEDDILNESSSYDDKASRRKGLLSTILSRSDQSSASTSTASSSIGSSNNTLG